MPQLRYVSVSLDLEDGGVQILDGWVRSEIPGNCGAAACATMGAAIG